MTGGTAMKFPDQNDMFTDLDIWPNNIPHRWLGIRQDMSNLQGQGVTHGDIVNVSLNVKSTVAGKGVQVSLRYADEMLVEDDPTPLKPTGYFDPNSPTGVDNVVLEGTSMPHVLWELQGLKRPFEGFSEEHSGDVDFEFLTTGKLSVEEYDHFIRDTVNFLEYVSEPIRSTRRNLGLWVLMFLFFFLMLSYLLKKEIWKDV